MLWISLMAAGFKKGLDDQTIVDCFLIIDAGMMKGNLQGLLPVRRRYSS
jgi:hypothetical protein